MNKQQREQQDIWFRNPMVWFIILLPLAVVIASMITIGIAHKYAPTITTDSASNFYLIVVDDKAIS